MKFFAFNFYMAHPGLLPGPQLLETGRLIAAGSGWLSSEGRFVPRALDYGYSQSPLAARAAAALPAAELT